MIAIVDVVDNSKVVSGVARIFRTSGHFSSGTYPPSSARHISTQRSMIFLLLFFYEVPSENPTETDILSPFDLWALPIDFGSTSGHLPRAGCAWLRHCICSFSVLKSFGLFLIFFNQKKDSKKKKNVKKIFENMS